MNWEYHKTNILNDALDMSQPLDGFDEQAPNRIVTSSALIIIDGDVITTYTNPDTEFSDESAEQNVNAIWNVIKDRTYYHLIVPDPSTHVTVEARDYSNPKFDSVKKAEAIVIKTLGHRMLAQFYVKARKGYGFPVRIFESEKDAIAWFDRLRESE